MDLQRRETRKHQEEFCRTEEKMRNAIKEIQTLRIYYEQLKQQLFVLQNQHQMAGSYPQVESIIEHFTFLCTNLYVVSYCFSLSYWLLLVSAATFKGTFSSIRGTMLDAAWTPCLSWQKSVMLMLALSVRLKYRSVVIHLLAVCMQRSFTTQCSLI